MVYCVSVHVFFLSPDSLLAFVRVRCMRTARVISTTQYRNVVDIHKNWQILTYASFRKQIQFKPMNASEIHQFQPRFHEISDCRIAWHFLLFAAVSQRQIIIMRHR